MKTLDYWAEVYKRAVVDRHAAALNLRFWGDAGLAPRRWRHASGYWVGYKGMRNAWIKSRRKARLAKREFEKVERRLAYAMERMVALAARTAWDRVLRKPMV
jgi:hypothetical protein